MLGHPGKGLWPNGPSCRLCSLKSSLPRERVSIPTTSCTAQGLLLLVSSALKQGCTLGLPNPLTDKTSNSSQETYITAPKANSSRHCATVQGRQKIPSPDANQGGVKKCLPGPQRVTNKAYTATGWEGRPSSEEECRRDAQDRLPRCLCPAPGSGPQCPSLSLLFLLMKRQTQSLTTLPCRLPGK